MIIGIGNDLTDIRRIEAIKEGDTVVGSHVRVKVVKNKVSPPFRQAEFDIMFGSGISRESGILDMGAQSGIVEKSGAWYVFKGEKLGQGHENSVDALRTNPKLTDELENLIRIRYLDEGKKEANGKPTELARTTGSAKPGAAPSKK